MSKEALGDTLPISSAHAYSQEDRHEPRRNRLRDPEPLPSDGLHGPVHRGVHDGVVGDWTGIGGDLFPLDMNATQPLMEHLPEPERIQAIQSLRREHKVQDAPVLLKQQAEDRSDSSEEAQVQLEHLEAECRHDSSDYARAVATYDRILAGRGDSVADANRGLSGDT